ncbi:hypothetical protein FE840_003075 [Peteryoungia desertarenae]|uniref:Uncharacterized protein n=1 Tax=Peteryoungia desertarenae TaxID=1813451 RepID=A0ABX6QJU3_9HYPH|nr:hypothetical protein [Peteryoungia desertarenae]QLF68611.1 hypothetical protein FE840_003075 [Peteryoungia desertarenae]
MVSASQGASANKADIVERAVRRINRQENLIPDMTYAENAAALLVYLYENGVHDEEELVELALMAKGKRYDPKNGNFV